MSFPFNGTVWTVLDSTGAPVPGAKVYTYDAGTLTAKAAYTTSALTTATSNPIIADSAGRVQFFLGSGSYRIRVFDASDVEITALACDNISDTSGAITSLQSSLASTASASVGAGQVGSLWTLNYAAGTVGNDLRYGSMPSIFKVLSAAQQADVLAYNFTLDLTSTIQAALALCRTWYFPAGGYKITDELAVTSGMRLRGDSNANHVYGAQATGHKPTRFWQATSGKAVFSIGGGVSDVVISDMAMAPVQTPAPYTAYTASTYGVRMMGANYVAAGTAYQQAGRSSYRITLKRLMGYQFERFISCTDYYWDTTGLTPPNSGSDWQCDAVTVEQCHSFGSLHHIYLQTINADAWLLKNCTSYIWTNGTGINLKRSGYLTAQACYWTPAEASAGVSVSGATAVFLDGYWDTVRLDGCAASDGIAYCIDRSAGTGFDNVYQPLVMQGCVMEGPSRIQRQTKVVSMGNRFTGDVTCSGDDIEVHSMGDGWNPTTKKFVMSGLRPRLFVHGGSTQTSGTTSVPTATATTILTIPVSAGTYRVQAWIAGNTPYVADATLICEGSQVFRLSGTNTSLSITTTGTNTVQVTHTFGSTQTVNWSWSRLS